MSQRVRIGLVQMACSSDPAQNLARAEKRVQEAAARGAQVVCLQELFRTPYFCQSEDVEAFDLAESIPGPTTHRFGRLAKQLGVALVVPLFERRAPGLYHNSAAVIGDDGSLLGRYRKMHIPDDPGFYEKFYFAPGDLGFQSHATAFGELGILICWDQWFPEAARLTTLRGARILFYPTAIGWADGQDEGTNRAQHQAWETVQRGHAVANGVFVAAVNRVGREGSLTFWGQSFVCDPLGKVVARASQSEEEALVVEVDLDQVEETRRHWPFLRDRRIDAYQGIRNRFLEGGGE